MGWRGGKESWRWGNSEGMRKGMSGWVEGGGGECKSEMEREI